MLPVLDTAVAGISDVRAVNRAPVTGGGRPGPTGRMKTLTVTLSANK